MASTVRIIGDNTIIWGSNGAYNGIVLSATNKKTGEKYLLKNNEGETVAVIYFDDQNQCQVEFVVQGAAPALTRGDSVTVCGISCLTEECELKYAQADVQKFSLTATKYNAMTL